MRERVSLLSTEADGVWDGEILVAERLFGAMDVQFSDKTMEAPGMNLLPGVTYCAQELHYHVSPYRRIPEHGLLLTDIHGDNGWWPFEDVCREADRVGMEVAPVIYMGIPIADSLPYTYWRRQSCLGGPIQGIEVRNYAKEIFATLWRPSDAA